MCQQELVEQVFQSLLNQGHTTTLDVKNKLRQDYPCQTWDQNFVSTCCLEYQEESGNIGFINNGTYREYFINVKFVRDAQPVREYSYTANGLTITADDWLTVVMSAVKLGHAIHWSQTKQQFYEINLMDSHHILNAINLYLDDTDMNPAQFAEFIQSSPYIKELVSRYPV